MQTLTGIFRRLAPALLIAAFVGCSDGPAEPAPAITVFSGPTAVLNVARGSAATTVVTVERTAKLQGDVHLSAENLPVGMLVSFSPSSLDKTETLSELTVTALSALPEGPHTFTIRATADDAPSKTATISINVTIPAMAMSLGANSATMEQGTTRSIPITITRSGGFTALVGLNVLGLPANVTGTFSPAVLQPGETTSTLTFSAPLIASITSGSVIVRASGTGVPEQAITIPLSVTAATTPAIYPTISSSTFQAIRGFTAVRTITVQRFATFTGAVSMQVIGLPTGVVASITPIASGSTSAELLLVVLPAAVNGAYPATVRLSGTGIQSVDIPIVVQVSTVSTFTFALQSTAAITQASTDLQEVTVTLPRGSTTQFSIPVTRLGGFAAGFTLSLEDLPAGITHTLPASLPATASDQLVDFSITIPANMAPGSYPIGVKLATSNISRTGTLTLVVGP